jgi:hypothetical protein
MRPRLRLAPSPRLAAFALALPLIATTLLAGCGGDGGGGTLTKAEFVTRGDEICKQAQEQFQQAQLSPPSTPQKAVALQEKLISVAEDQVTEIRALGAPTEVKPALNRYLNAREQGIALLKQGLKAAQSKDLRAYAAAQSELASGQVHRLQLAQAVGFSQCSRPASSSAGAGG